jgi:hypothetical protein
LRLFMTVAAITLISASLFTGCAPATQVSQNQADTPAAVSAHDEYSVEIEGSEMKKLTIQQVADLWKIDSQKLLDGIVAEFKLKNKYSTASVLDELRVEYKFSPALIKEIAEKIKTGI